MSSNRKDYQVLKRAWTSDRGQHPKAVALRTRKPKAPARPTWPATKDQRHQTRPVIVLHPVRQLGVNRNESARQRLRKFLGNTSKCVLDAMAVQ